MNKVVFIVDMVYICFMKLYFNLHCYSCLILEQIKVQFYVIGTNKMFISTNDTMIMEKYNNIF